MAANFMDKKNEELNQEQLIKKLTYLESLVSCKDRTIQGQNGAIQTLTAQNLMFRDLLKEVLDLKISFFNKDKLALLQKKIQEKLNECVNKRQVSSVEVLMEQNSILRDLAEQLLSLKISIFNMSNLTKLQEYARKKLDDMRYGRQRS